MKDGVIYYNYETVIIFEEKLNKTEYDKIVKKYEDIIRKLSGKIISTEKER